MNDGNRNRRRHSRLGVFPVADRDEAEHCCEQQSDAAEERAQGGPEENAYKPFETKTTEEEVYSDKEAWARRDGIDCCRYG